MKANIKSLIFQCVQKLDCLCRYIPRVGKFRPLRGGFCAFELVNRGVLPGAILHRSQPPGPSSIGSMTERCGMRQHDHQPWPIFWTRSDDARLVGRMSDWRNVADFRCSEAVFGHQKRRRLRQDRLFAQILVKKPRFLPGAWTSLGSTWADGTNYYHWLLDGLTRLMVWEALPEPTRILLPRSTAGFIGETIEMLGLTDMAEHQDEDCVQPARFYFCSPLAMTGVSNPIGYNWLRKSFAHYLEPTATGQPIFLTRRSGARVPTNIEEIEGGFIHRGFMIVDCGEIPVKEQMKLVSMAPAVAGLHGAAMTNLLWARPGIPVLEIFEQGFLNACYEQIALHGGLNYKYETIDSAGDLFRVSEGWLNEHNDI